MPLYEYQCEKCGHRFEKIQKFSDALETVCPKCGGVVRKLVSSPAIQFKGSGFYITDYGKKDSGSEAKTETKAKAEAKADAKSDSATKDTKAGTDAPKDTKADTAATKDTKVDKPAAPTKSE